MHRPQLAQKAGHNQVPHEHCQGCWQPVLWWPGHSCPWEQEHRGRHPARQPLSVARLMFWAQPVAWPQSVGLTLHGQTCPAGPPLGESGQSAQLLWVFPLAVIQAAAGLLLQNMQNFIARSPWTLELLPLKLLTRPGSPQSNAHCTPYFHVNFLSMPFLTTRQYRWANKQTNLSCVTQQLKGMPNASC